MKTQMKIKTKQKQNESERGREIGKQLCFGSDLCAIWQEAECNIGRSEGPKKRKINRKEKKMRTRMKGKG